ncbi:hypothetical protein DID77_01215 [Candidatus Marinamargulisbacteria bacterium SCGC AG-439-L15]|nr:hypothetical protein DID77_01215 [Candidatus Marinamargulisbacteria bacterium SCGC AG-439-L15]
MFKQISVDLKSVDFSELTEVQVSEALKDPNYRCGWKEKLDWEEGATPLQRALNLQSTLKNVKNIKSIRPL